MNHLSSGKDIDGLLAKYPVFAALVWKAMHNSLTPDELGIVMSTIASEDKSDFRSFLLYSAVAYAKSVK